MNGCCTNNGCRQQYSKILYATINTDGIASGKMIRVMKMVERVSMPGLL
jgi:hypothetical protein